MATICRMVQRVGTQIVVFGVCPHHHAGQLPADPADWDRGLATYRATHPPILCEQCGEPVTVSGMSQRPVYDTPDGTLSPGDMYWQPHPTAAPCWEWDNCSGQHLCVILPNGIRWDIDSRAANCTLPHDRRHRCWIRHGDPPHVTVGKDGATCAAGAGSIRAGNYHGYLRNGVLTDPL